MVDKLITNNTAEWVGDKKFCYVSQGIIGWELDTEIWFDAVKFHLTFYVTESFWQDWQRRESYVHSVDDQC